MAYIMAKWGMAMNQKVTIHLPKDLLKKAQKATSSGITETIRRGLELVAAAETYENLRSLKGKVKFGIDIHKLREDRK